MFFKNLAFYFCRLVFLASMLSETFEKVSWSKIIAVEDILKPKKNMRNSTRFKSFLVEFLSVSQSLFFHFAVSQYYLKIVRLKCLKHTAKFQFFFGMAATHLICKISFFGNLNKPGFSLCFKAFTHSYNLAHYMNLLWLLTEAYDYTKQEQIFSNNKVNYRSKSGQ